MLRESATGKAVSFAASTSTNNSDIPAQCGTSAVVYNNNSRVGISSGSTYTQNGVTAGRVRRSGANIVVSISKDLVNWDDIYTIATASVFTSAPDQVAFGVASTDAAAVNLLHFKYGSL